MQRPVTATMIVVSSVFLSLVLIAGNCFSGWVEPPGTPFGIPNYTAYDPNFPGPNTLASLYDEPTENAGKTLVELDEGSSFGITFTTPAEISGVRFYSYAPAYYWNHISKYYVQARYQPWGSWTTIVPEKSAVYPRGLPGWTEVTFPLNTYYGIRIVPTAVYYCCAPRVGEMQFLAPGPPVAESWRIPPDAAKYIVQNNILTEAPGPQVLNVETATGDFVVASANHDKPLEGPPAAYPAIFKGCILGTCSSNSGLPKKIHEIFNASSSWQFAFPASGAFTAGYDLWVNKTQAAAVPDGAIVMVFLNYQGNVNPFGTMIAARVPLAGLEWEVWIGSMEGVTTLSYVLSSGVDAVCDLNLKAFLADAQQRGFIRGDWYLTAVGAGFSIWKGGTGLVSKGFKVLVE